jgi:hypothetical protein
VKEQQPTQLPAIRVHDIRIDSAFELLEAMRPDTGILSGGTIFRGQADADWGLTPAVFREEVPYLLPERYFPRHMRVYGAQVKLEIELLWLFATRANGVGLTIPGDSEQIREDLDRIRHDRWWVADPGNLRSWPPRNLIPIMALAQHHGVPTRLLDWTYSAYTAIYFAAEGAARRKPRTGRLAIWVCHLHENRRWVKRAASVEIVRPSNAINPNLRAQRGCLMVWRKGAKAEAPMSSARLEVLLSEEADRAGTMGPPIFYKVTVPQTESGALLQLLSMHELDGATLFPGFDGAARVVRERVYWDEFEGTGAQPFDAELNKRRTALSDRYLGGVPVYDTRYNQRYDNYDIVRNMIAATRCCLDAGDYDPKLAHRIERLDQVQEALEKQNADPALRAELSKLIADLKKVRDGAEDSKE